ncbi:hypothetical protein EDD40_5762 [Saccharothrix texasensis]|uniref:Uncharacterized protein n=1 Tax=Saccharothrix texasensis TaxID=103734 RepID=A0A3N1HCW1_9PSEU|nr:hypothetical protein [Saccharothrix texasensis]ROP40354.1 hypothetical protein EDD40_5762 [Saccharothrix texasensis]
MPRPRYPGATVTCRITNRRCRLAKPTVTNPRTRGPSANTVPPGSSSGGKTVRTGGSTGSGRRVKPPGAATTRSTVSVVNESSSAATWS